VLILSLMTIIFIYIYSLKLDYAWLALLLFPFAIVPYTHFFSFVFPSEDGGEKFMLIHNFVIGGVVPTAVLILRIISTTKKWGIALFWIFKFSPMFCLCEVIVNVASRDVLG